MNTFADMLRAEIQATHEYAVATDWLRALTWARIPDIQYATCNEHLHRLPM